MYSGRNDSGGPGDSPSLLRRIFGDGENPLTWALPLGAIWGSAIRVHLAFVLYIVIEFALSFRADALGPLYTAMAVGSLFVLVLLHEFGHCFGCRRVGGEADEILMWPLGGLAMCLPPDHWRAHMVTVLAGPGVNAVLLPIFAAALWLTTGDAAAVVFNPFDPKGAILFADLSDGSQPWWLVLLWWLHYANLILLAFNVLVPMFPMDGGRILHAGLWARMGRQRATEITVIVGFVAAVTMFIAAMVGENTVLMALAIFGGISCWMERQRSRMEAEMQGFGGGLDLSAAYADPEDRSGGSKQANPSRAERRARDQAERQQQEVDRILEKISRSGLDSLTRAEKKALDRARTRDSG